MPAIVRMAMSAAFVAQIRNCPWPNTRSVLLEFPSDMPMAATRDTALAGRATVKVGLLIPQYPDSLEQRCLIDGAESVRGEYYERHICDGGGAWIFIPQHFVMYNHCSSTGLEVLYDTSRFLS